MFWLTKPMTDNQTDITTTKLQISNAFVLWICHLPRLSGRILTVWCSKTRTCGINSGNIKEYRINYAKKLLCNCRLKATKEHILKFPSSFSLKITRLTNPSAADDTMAANDIGDTADLPPSKKPRMFSKRSQRKKKTLPKPQELGAEQLSALNTPPVTPPLKCDQSNAKTSFATPELTKGISSSNYDEDDPPVDVFVSLKNYRRFSSRARKKPDFFHVSQVTPSESLQSQRAAVGVKRKAPVPPAKRMLRFDDHPVLMQEAPLPSSDRQDTMEVCLWEWVSVHMHIYTPPPCALVVLYTPHMWFVCTCVVYMWCMYVCGVHVCVYVCGVHVCVCVVFMWCVCVCVWCTCGVVCVCVFV